MIVFVIKFSIIILFPLISKSQKAIFDNKVKIIIFLKILFITCCITELKQKSHATSNKSINFINQKQWNNHKCCKR